MDQEVRSNDTEEPVGIPEEDFRFAEQTTTPFADRDRDHFLRMLDNPPAANEALRRACTKHAAETAK
ncbi:DUF1778 domain-containing protein [Paludisphaera borealis]|uniref:type II toxin -antitoxin system TacA 1-like antitoxin n=1 Tax=Paludisphaera borealis TaxID=1387353 RepID=UPI0011AB4C95|nr:DUF1778 domain-containing protein [Paludisphaera borealis]